MKRPAVALTLDGQPGFWLEASVAGRYAAVVGKLLATERRRYPDAVPPLDLLLAQYVLLGSANGTELVPGATVDADSLWVKAPAADRSRRCEGWLAVADAACSAGVTPRAIRRAIADGRLSAVKAGREWLIGEGELQDFERKRAARNGGTD